VTAQAAATVGEVIEAERIVALAMLLALTCKECGSKDCDSVQMERRQAVDCAESVRRAAQLARGFAASQDRGNQHSRAAEAPKAGRLPVRISWTDVQTVISKEMHGRPFEDEGCISVHSDAVTR
jgi:hypothetical protein